MYELHENVPKWTDSAMHDTAEYSSTNVIKNLHLCMSLCTFQGTRTLSSIILTDYSNFSMRFF